MKCFVVTVFTLLACCVNSQLVLELPQNENGLNLREIITSFFNFLSENKNSVPACDVGFELKAVGDFWKCVAKAEKEELLVPLCPESTICVSNPSCSSGFHLLRHEENCCCVKEDIAVSAEALPIAAPQPTLVVQCPEAEICPQNPTCFAGNHLLKHEENCCCVKEDVFVNGETDKDNDGLVDPKICPMCSPTELGNVDCDCLMPMKKFESSIDSSLKCCLEN